MYGYSTIGKIPSQVFTNGSYQLTRYFTTGNEKIAPMLLIYECVYRLTFDSGKSD